MARHDRAPLRRYEQMSRLKDYSIEKGLSDPRGWKVVDSAGQEVGGVTDLIVDTDRMTASHLEVELDRKSLGLRDDSRILVPMSRAERDGSGRRLTVPTLSRSRITALFDAKAQHDASFWDEWWSHADSSGPQDTASAGHADDPAPVRDRAVREAELGRAVSEIRPGEEIRIPVGGDEVVVERRRVDSADPHGKRETEAMIARETEETRLRRQARDGHPYSPTSDPSAGPRDPDDPLDVDAPGFRSRVD